MRPVEKHGVEGFAYHYKGMIYYTSPSEVVMSVKILNGLIFNRYFKYFHGIKRVKHTDYLVFTTLDTSTKIESTVPYMDDPYMNPLYIDLINLINENTGFDLFKTDISVYEDMHAGNWGLYNGKWYCFDPLCTMRLPDAVVDCLDMNKIIAKYDITCEV